MPLYVLGLEGMTRRMQHYDVAAWHPWLIVAAVGAALILAGIGCQIAQLVVSIRNREALRDLTGDPWDGRTLEWITASPPPAFNFAVLPNVTGEEAYWGIKQKALEQRRLTDLPRLQADRNAAQQPDRLRHRVLRGRHRLRADLAHLVDGRRRPRRRLRDLRCVRLARSWRNTTCPPTKSPRSTANGARRASPWSKAASPASRRSNTTEPPEHDPHKLGAAPSPTAATRDRRPKRIVTGYGFWIFLLSDFVMFSGFYAAYAVLSHATAGGPGPHDLFDLNDRRARDRLPAALELRLRHGDDRQQRAQHAVDAGLLSCVTGLLGARLPRPGSQRVRQDAGGRRGPERSAFLSAFFALVGCHGLHVTVGLLWLGTMMAQFWAKGFRPDILRRGLCFGLFWHALDIIWVGIFTNVYLLGTSPSEQDMSEHDARIRRDAAPGDQESGRIRSPRACAII